VQSLLTDGFSRCCCCMCCRYYVCCGFVVFPEKKNVRWVPYSISAVVEEQQMMMMLVVGRDARTVDERRMPIVVCGSKGRTWLHLVVTAALLLLLWWLLRCWNPPNSPVAQLQPFLTGSGKRLLDRMNQLNGRLHSLSSFEWNDRQTTIWVNSLVGSRNYRW